LRVSTVSIELSQHETESEEKIIQVIEYLFPSEVYEKIDEFTTVHNLTGFHKNQIKLYKIQSLKQKQNKLIFSYVINKIIPETDFESIWDRFSSEENSLYLRINKQDLLKSRQFRLDEGSDIIKIVFKFIFLGKKNSSTEERKEYLNNQLFG
jgi:RNA binding exosome subunit